jgi:MYXO-CTERM domain-containing protein
MRARLSSAAAIADTPAVPPAEPTLLDTLARLNTDTTGPLAVAALFVVIGLAGLIARRQRRQR